MNSKHFLQIIALFFMVICCCLVSACGTSAPITETDSTNIESAETDTPSNVLESATLPETTAEPLPTLGADAIPCNMYANPYSSLSVPTHITHIGDDYFLVDCYHNQILTSTSLEKPLCEWNVLTDQIKWGHTIAGNGSIYVADDTENHRLLVFTKYDSTFYQTQIIENVGNRPHYVEYNPDTERFYVLSSMSSELYIYYQDPLSFTLCLDTILEIPNMEGVYIRSFTFMDGYIYFAANNGIILRCNPDDLCVLEVWFLPDQLAGLIQMIKIEDYYYLTVSTDINGNADYATIIRTTNLAFLENYEYEDLYQIFAGIGTPYYISSFDGHYYLTQHCSTPGYGVWQFDISDNELHNVMNLFP